ncbi:MAG TPA: hypothetical protein DEB06_01285 [Phycisphaerales bacterium]|nr:hypothetical protein [Phycisphaerales bacterium]
MTRAPTSYHRAVPTAAALILLAGCVSPLQEASTETLRESVRESAARELRPSTDRPEPVDLVRQPGELSFPPERLQELERMAGPTAYEPGVPPLSPGLPDEVDLPVRMSLQQAVLRAIEHNLGVQSARIDPAIAEAQVVAARAAFDWVFFGNVEWSSVDEPQLTPQVGGVNVGTSSRVNQSVGYTTGIRKQLTSGGNLSISQGQTYLDNRDTGTQFSPDPSNRAELNIAYDQPLLRGFGSDVALAEVRLAQNTERRSVEEYRRTLIATVTEVERAYWDLVQAQQNLKIFIRLLERGVETRDVLKSRLAFDVKPAEFSDAVATVERRRANVIRATNTLRQQSDRLKALINDPDLTVGSDALIDPADNTLDAPVAVSLYDSLTTALANRPEVQIAILSIDDASIRQTVADNARLPLLDLSFAAQFQGLDRDVGDAYSDVGSARFVDLLLGAVFEQPIGNRAAEAQFRQRQLERMQSAVGYRRTVQDIALEVRTALRNLSTNYRLIEQTRTARLAAAENLRTLLVQEQTIQSLTPDFLDLKFRRQEALAAAEGDEVQALADYSIALAELHRATGTALERNRVRFVVPDAGARR